MLPISEAETAYQIILNAVDQPGVLAAIARVFADNQVSVAAIHQSLPEDLSGLAKLVITTAEAREEALQTTVAELRALDVVSEIVSILRVLHA